VAHGHDGVGVGQIVVHQGGYALPPQQRLIRHLKEDGPADVPKLLHPQMDRVTDAPLRVPVADTGEAEGLGQRGHFVVLGDHRDGGELLRRNRLQRPPDQALAAHLRRQLVGAEAGGIAGRHNQTADGEPIALHGITPFLTVSPL